MATNDVICLRSTYRKQNLKLCSVFGMKEQIKVADDRATSFVKFDLCDQILRNRQVLKGHIQRQHIQKKLCISPTTRFYFCVLFCGQFLKG